jgi:nucleotide-binding universal stress UspA family protein
MVLHGQRSVGDLDVGSRRRRGRRVTGLRLKSVVVGYDGSPPSDRAVDRAATLVGSGGGVIVVTARPSLASQGVISESILDAPPADERSELLERSRALLRERGVGATLVAANGDPAEALIQVAQDEDAEMILVGHTGTGYVTRALLGSTAENVLRHAPCDVLVVR